MKNLYKLEGTATNEADELIFKMMSENFRKNEEIITKLVRSGQMKIK
jgi:hypothetical protein